jgi:hypothetical protein
LKGRKIEDLNFEFAHKIREQPWRQQVLRFYDYDKNLIEIGESMEHVAYRLHLEKVAIEEIEKITYLNRLTIEKAITTFS